MQAPSGMTIELSRALARLIVDGEERARPARRRAQRKLIRARRICAAAGASLRESLLCPYILGVSEDRELLRASKSRRRRSQSQARRRAWKRGARPRRAYQFETARALIAIEFFLAAVIIFLSSRRCKGESSLSIRPANSSDSRRAT